MMRRSTKIIVTTRQYDALIATLRRAFPAGKSAYELAIAHPDIPLDDILYWLGHEYRVQRHWRDGNYYIIPNIVLIRLMLWNLIYLCGLYEMFLGKAQGILLAICITITSTIFLGMEFWPW